MSNAFYCILKEDFILRVFIKRTFLGVSYFKVQPQNLFHKQRSLPGGISTIWFKVQFLEAPLQPFI